MPAVNRQEPGIHPAVSSRAVHLPDGNDFGTGTFTTALAPNALTATETIESLIMLPPDSEVAIHVNPVKWQVEVFLGPPFSSLPSETSIGKAGEGRAASREHSASANPSHR